MSQNTRTPRRATTPEETQESLQEQARRADAAKAIIESPLMQETYATLEAIYLKAWKQCDAATSEGIAARERLHVKVCMLEDFISEVRVVAERGFLARDKIKSQIRKAG